MKSLTSKFILSVLSLVLTGVALSVGVYAWFTINNTAQVDQFSADVRAGSGFYISLNGTQWYTDITTDMITEYLSSAKPNFQFDNVTSPDGVTFKTLAGATANTANYIEFPLYFAGNASLSYVQLTGLTIGGSQTDWVPGINVPNTRAASPANPSTPVTDYASNAVRISFADQLYDAENGTQMITVFEKGTSQGNTLGKGASFTANEAVQFYNAVEDDDITEAMYNAAVLPPTLQAANSGMEVNVAPLYAIGDVTSEVWGITTLPTGVTNVLGEDAEVAFMMVRVWIEGWDAQAFNAILSGTVTLSFDFQGA